MKKSYRIKREGDFWVPQWCESEEFHTGWYYYLKCGERVKFGSRLEAHIYLDWAKAEDESNLENR